MIRLPCFSLHFATANAGDYNLIIQEQLTVVGHVLLQKSKIIVLTNIRFEVQNVRSQSF
jgi:hypothetical protein